MAKGKALEWALSEPWAVTREALETGLRIAAREGEGPEAVAAKRGKPLENTREVTYREGPKGKTAIIPIVGPIFRYADSFGLISGGVSIETLATDFTAALDDPDVNGIVLAIDSPGGQVSGTGEFAAMIRAARKPVVAHVSDVGASAAYWIASAARGGVVVSEGGRVGSIGVIMSAFSRQDRPGEFTFISGNAPLKRSDPATDQGKAQIQGMVDDLHAIFEGAVATYRGVSREVVRTQFGRGGVLIASRALKAGMIDAVGSFESVVEAMGRGEYPGRKGSSKKGSTMPKPKGILERLFGAAASTDEGLAALRELAADNGGDDDDDDIVPQRKATGRIFASNEGGTIITASEREELERLRAQVKSDKARSQGEKVDAAIKAAESGAEALVKAKKVTPANRQAVAILLAQAAIDDAGIVANVHAAGKAMAVQMGHAPTNRSAMIRAAFDGVEPHSLDEDALPGGLITVNPVKPKAEGDGLDDAKLDAAADAWAFRKFVRKA